MRAFYAWGIYTGLVLESEQHQRDCLPLVR